MILSGRDAPGYFARPDPARPGILIHGQDPVRVAARRAQVVAALAGPEAVAEMRLTRLTGAELRRDPAAVLDALKATGFFPGPRVVVVEEASDGLGPVLAEALASWRPGDAALVVSAGALGKASALRKAFEAHAAAYAVAIYDDPPSRAEVEAMLTAEGLSRIAPPAMAQLMDLAGALSPGDFRQMAVKLGLYMLSAPGTEVVPEDVAAVAPALLEADVDDLVAVVAEGRSAEIGPLMARIEAQGANPVSLVIAATRHFRTLLTVAADPGGPAQGIGRLRPPVFGPRRDRIERQARGWTAAKLERALTLLTDTDLTLRSAARVPGRALVERALFRLAALNRE